jgi:site-specific DNA-methyltransferase (adenine-specific)
MQDNKQRAKRNRTLSVTESEIRRYSQRLLIPEAGVPLQEKQISGKTILGDLMNVIDLLPAQCADLIIIDPPYNLDKEFNGLKFKATEMSQYLDYLRSWFPRVCRLLKEEGSLYLCGDWKSTAALQIIMQENLHVMNRITWQREKGRGAQTNWKNGMEDIWFGVKNKNRYYFNTEPVMMKRRVMAPYRDQGKPKDWVETESGKFRLTHPSNFWDDISIPYWSMPENTDHPTQKPEKLIAKLILASCPPGGLVFDPFLGSGTTSVVAKKLDRKFFGVEMNHEYAVWCEKRLSMAEKNKSIQGYADGVFWERNTLNAQKAGNGKALNTPES